jgi:hypothetical protein
LRLDSPQSIKYSTAATATQMQQMPIPAPMGIHLVLLLPLPLASLCTPAAAMGAGVPEAEGPTEPAVVLVVPLSAVRSMA